MFILIWCKHLQNVHYSTIFNPGFTNVFFYAARGSQTPIMPIHFPYLHPLFGSLGAVCLQQSLFERQGTPSTRLSPIEMQRLTVV